MSNISKPEKDIAALESQTREELGYGPYRPIWEVIDEIMRGVPEAALSRLPTDGAERHDHYLSRAHEKAPQES